MIKNVKIKVSCSTSHTHIRSVNENTVSKIVECQKIALEANLMSIGVNTTLHFSFWSVRTPNRYNVFRDICLTIRYISSQDCLAYKAKLLIL